MDVQWGYSRGLVGEHHVQSPYSSFSTIGTIFFPRDTMYSVYWRHSSDSTKAAERQTMHVSAKAIASFVALKSRSGSVRVDSSVSSKSIQQSRFAL